MFKDRPDTEKKNIRILLVEDNEVNVVLVQQYLKRWGMKAEVVGDGKAALEKMKANKYDIVLMDLNMPVMNGYDATRKIREMEGSYFENVPIIAVTAYSMPEVRNDYLSYGFNDYICKPFQAEVLKEKISKYSEKFSYRVA